MQLPVLPLAHTNARIRARTHKPIPHATNWLVLYCDDGNRDVLMPHIATLAQEPSTLPLLDWLSAQVHGTLHHSKGPWRKFRGRDRGGSLGEGTVAEV